MRTGGRVLVLGHPADLLQPAAGVEVVDQFRHLRDVRGYAACPEGSGEIHVALAHGESVALKRRDAATDPQRGRGTCEVQPVSGCLAVQDCAALLQQPGEFIAAGGASPQRRPELGTYVGPVGFGDASPASGSGMYGEWKAGAALGSALVAAGSGTGKQDRSLQCQHEVPWIGVCVAVVPDAGVRSSRRARCELARRVRTQTLRCVGLQRRLQKPLASRLRCARGRIEQTVSISNQPAHEVVGEVEAAIVAAGSEQLRKAETFPGQSHGGIQPMQGGVIQKTAQRLHEGRFGARFGPGRPSSAANLTGGHANGLRDGPEARRRRRGERPDTFLVVVRIEAAAAVPGRNDRARRVVLQKEAKQIIRPEAGGDMEAPVLPPTPSVGVGGDTARVIGRTGNKTQYPKCLQVARQRGRRTSVQPDCVSRHSRLSLRPPMRASRRYAARLPGTRAETGHSRPASHECARSNWLRSERPRPTP